MVTYNHERYIGQAIESVLMQETSFPIELIVGEDCSKDGTRAVVRRYATQRPDIVRPILHERNVGMGANAAAVAAACRGEFIAVLEGDDYWTDPRKLQRQVEWLDAHPDANFCFHDVHVIRGETGEVLRRHCNPKPGSRVTISDLLAYNPVPTCSVVYRRLALPPMCEHIRKLGMQDWPSWIQLAERSYGGYLDETWGVYRLHGSGAWSTMTAERQYQSTLDFYSAMLQVLGPEYHAQIRAARKRLLPPLINILVQAGRWREARQYVIEHLSQPPHRLRPPAGQAMLYARILLKRPSAPMENPLMAPATAPAPEFDRTRAP